MGTLKLVNRPLLTMMLFRRTIFLLVFFSSGFLFGEEKPLGPLHWNAWRTLPVYDEGRIMPLNTFSRTIVTQICGVPNPRLVVDDILYSNIESALSLKYKQNPAVADDEADRIRKRIDALFPQGERTFESYELLLSWLIEPEVWDFIPFLAHRRACDFRAEILSASRINQRGRPIDFIAPIQLETSGGYLTLLDRVRDRQMQAAHQAREGGDVSKTVQLSENETVAVELHQLSDIYQSLTYRSEQVLPEFSSTFLLSLRNAQQGFSSASQSWNRLVQQGIERTLPKRDITVSERFNAIALILSQIQRQIHDQETQTVSLSKIELELDTILKLTDGALADGDAIYQLLYFSPEASTSYFKEIRNSAVVFHSSLALLRRATQAASLSLYQTGRTIRVLPALYDDVLRPDIAGCSGFGLDMRSPFELPDTSPWVSLNLVLRAGPTTIRRFVDREFPLEPDENIVLSDLFEMELYSTFGPALQNLLQKPSFVPPTQTNTEKNSTLVLRETFRKLSNEFEETKNGAMISFVQSIRETAQRMERVRKELLPADKSDPSHLMKTAYPKPGALNVEYLYSRFNPFYWMGITAGISLVLLACSFISEWRRRFEMAANRKNTSSPKQFGRLRHVEEFFLWSGIFFLVASILITLAGGILRAWISGWAPVSNMFETIVLMAFVAACLGLWLTMQPLLAPPLAQSWKWSAFPRTPWGRRPSVHNDAEFPDDSPEMFYRAMLSLFRVFLIFLTFWGVLFVSYYEYTDAHRGLFDAILSSFTMKDPIDWIAVSICFCIVIWFTPRFLITCLLLPWTFFTPSRLKHLPVEDAPDSTLIQGPLPQNTPTDSHSPVSLEPESVESLLKGPYQQVPQSDGSYWWFQARQHLLHRKTFVFAGTLIVCIAALITQFNHKEFNPNIRPLAAVLRSNFWLAVHVITIMIGYAAGLIAWLLALASLSMSIFGRYRKVEYGKSEIVVLPPYFCDTLTPHIRKMLQVAVWMLMIGTILGARWADYSWGRFWSWDVKEVWALISLLVLLLVLHGRKAKFYGEFGVTIGAVFGAIAIIMTWYGFNYVFNVGRHAYGHGDSTWAWYFLIGFVIANIVWTLIAIGRHTVENNQR
ncbi:MAG: cytochrome c biogenesis protein [Planctomycetaceae bacterium]|nr:cytochrome c biogenesis protein [Planctomycetaceae bacterium]